MKAIILNSGIGKRMGKLTKNTPKCLMEISKGKTILGRQLEILINNGISNVIITTGHFGDRIKEYIKNNFPELNVKYVHNPKYDSTNYIYSVFLTKDLIDDDIIFMVGDLVFVETVFKKLLDSKEQNVVLINNKAQPPEKDFKGKIENGIVKEISVDNSGKNCFFLAPVYKFSKEKFLLWLKEIEKFVKRKETNVYAENAFNTISSQINLKPIYFNKEFCMEVDTNDDLEIVREYFKRD